MIIHVLKLSECRFGIVEEALTQFVVELCGKMHGKVNLALRCWHDTTQRVA